MISIPGVSGLVLLAAAANAHVYSGVDDAHGRAVAVKVLRIGDAAVSRRFERERRAMGRLSAIPNVASIYTSGFTDANEPFIVMPLYAQSLQSHIDQNGPVSWEQALRTIVPVSVAIERSHELGVLHLDLKPANILLDSEGDPHVADFGISVFLEATGSLSGSMLTPDFSPPERFDEAAPSASTDVYGLGATMFTLLTGRPPFSSERATGPAATMRRILMDPLPIERLPNNTPKALVDTIDRAMVKDPTLRTSSAAEFVDSLRELHEPLRSRTPPLSVPSDEVVPEAQNHEPLSDPDGPIDASSTQVASAAMSEVILDPATTDGSGAAASTRGTADLPTRDPSSTQSGWGPMSEVLLEQDRDDLVSAKGWRRHITGRLVGGGVLLGALVAAVLVVGVLADRGGTDATEVEAADTARSAEGEGSGTTTSAEPGSSTNVLADTAATTLVTPTVTRNPVAAISLGIPSRRPAVADTTVFIPSANSPEIRRVDVFTHEELEPVVHPSGPGDAAVVVQQSSRTPFLVGVGSAILDDFVIYDAENGSAVADVQIPDQTGHVLGVDRNFWVFTRGAIVVVRNTLSGEDPTVLEPVELGCTCDVTASSVLDGLVYAVSFGRITVIDPSTIEVVGSVEFDRQSPLPPVAAGGLVWTHVSTGDEVVAIDPTSFEVVDRVQVLDTVTGLASAGNSLVAVGFSGSRVISAQDRVVTDSISVGGYDRPLVADGLIFIPGGFQMSVVDLSTTTERESHVLDLGVSALGIPRDHGPFLVREEVWYLSEGGELIVLSPFEVPRG